MCIKIVILIIAATELVWASRRIPDEFLPCYRGDEGPKLPATIKTVIDLIQKLERTQTIALDMRMMSYALLHRYRIDGIQRARGSTQTETITPYRPTGMQVPKFELLLNRLVPSDVDQAMWLNDTSLTIWERCALHKLLSSTVEPWERGDEHTVCPLTRSTSEKMESVNVTYLNRRRPYAKTDITRFQSASEISRCPIQGGVVANTWGDVSPGALLGAIAAILQPQSIHPMQIFQGMSAEQQDMIQSEEFIQEFSKSEDSISNLWAATLAGDLAEVAVYQGPYFGAALMLGPGGYWNDTSLPRDSYLPQSHRGRWEMTNAEILAGLDGLILSASLPTWLTITSRMRLSQVFDGYYSERGVRFLEGRSAACERQRYLDDVVPQALLAQQCAATAQVLSYTANVPYVQRPVMDQLCAEAAGIFASHTERMLSNIRGCNMERAGTMKSTPSMRLTIIVDGTYSKYQILQLLSLLTDAADVGIFGSSLGVLDGQYGKWISNHSNSVAEIFANVHNYTELWPTSLHLTPALEQLVWYLQEPTDRQIGDLAHCIVVLAQESKISTGDLRTAKQLLQNTIGQYPDMYFRYITQDTATFNELSVDQLHTEKQINIATGDLAHIVNALAKTLDVIPKRLVSKYCHSDNRTAEYTSTEYEDYITPGNIVRYRIHPYYLKYADDVSIHFRGYGYGDISICLSRDEINIKGTCKTLSGIQDMIFNVTRPCENVAECAPVFLTVSVINTLTQCSEDDCRYPDQIRYSIRHEGLRCETDGVNTASKFSLNSIYVFITFITIILHIVI